MMDFNREFNHGCPCKGCEDRIPEPNCHGTCEKYKEWRAKLDKHNQAVRSRHKNNDTMSDSKKKAIWRSQRYSRQGYKNSSKA